MLLRMRFTAVGTVMLYVAPKVRRRMRREPGEEKPEDAFGVCIES